MQKTNSQASTVAVPEAQTKKGKKKKEAVEEVVVKRNMVSSRTRVSLTVITH